MQQIPNYHYNSFMVIMYECNKQLYKPWRLNDNIYHESEDRGYINLLLKSDM